MWLSERQTTTPTHPPTLHPTHTHAHKYSLLIDGHKQEVLLEDVHVARPCLDPLVAPQALADGGASAVLAGVVAPRQLLVEEAAEDVRALHHRRGGLVQEEPGEETHTTSALDTHVNTHNVDPGHTITQGTHHVSPGHTPTLDQYQP